MKTVKIREVVLGEGRPKICVPIVETTKEEIFRQAERVTHLPADMIEWRADWFEEGLEFAQVEEVLRQLKTILYPIPLLFTFRTKAEGGEQSIEKEAYQELLKKVAKSGCADLIDVELFSGEELVTSVIETAHQHQVAVVVSSHDFVKTPEKEVIVARLSKMEALGADLSKIAVMPKDKQDMLTLLAATEEAYQNCEKPIITMSMGQDGMLSRICGEICGSALTFASAGKASASGQIDVQDLANLLSLIHKNS